MATAKIIGVYTIPEAPEPCHFIEMEIHDAEGPFDVGAITQEDNDGPEEDFQVPYDERIISADGLTVLTESFEADEKPELWNGSFRLGFFFHYLDPNRWLATPFGEIPLPDPQPFPTRLAVIKYEPPG